MEILPKEIYIFHVIPIKLPMAIFTKLEQIILKLYGTIKDPEFSKLSGVGGARGITLPVFRLYYKTTITKKVWYWYKNRHTDQSE